jgi:MFS family permease
MAADAVHRASDRFEPSPGRAMGKIGILSIAAILLFGLIIPFAAYRLARRFGFRLLIALALAVGLGYGALKSDAPWTGQGLAENVALILASALVVALYIGLSVGATSPVARVIARDRR